MSNKPNFCSNCGERLELNEERKYCPKCGIDLQTAPLHPTPTPNVQYVPHKSPGTAALIAFIGGLIGLPGIGHMYVGKVGRGIGILILGFILYGIVAFAIFSTIFLAVPSQYESARNVPNVGPAVAFMFIFGFIYLIFFIWQIFSARNLARKFNRLAKTTGTEPW